MVRKVGRLCFSQSGLTWCHCFYACEIGPLRVSHLARSSRPAQLCVVSTTVFLIGGDEPTVSLQLLVLTGILCSSLLLQTIFQPHNSKILFRCAGHVMTAESRPLLCRRGAVSSAATDSSGDSLTFTLAHRVESLPAADLTSGWRCSAFWGALSQCTPQATSSTPSVRAQASVAKEPGLAPPPVHERCVILIAATTPFTHPNFPPPASSSVDAIMHLQWTASASQCSPSPSSPSMSFSCALHPFPYRALVLPAQ